MLSSLRFTTMAVFVTGISFFDQFCQKNDNCVCVWRHHRSVTKRNLALRMTTIVRGDMSIAGCKEESGYCRKRHCFLGDINGK